MSSRSPPLCQSVLQGAWDWLTGFSRKERQAWVPFPSTFIAKIAEAT